MTDIVSIAAGVVIGVTVAAAFAAPKTPRSLVTKDGGFFSGSYDVTDDAETGTRSGLQIYVDHGTGVQYVGTMQGGLTPRVDHDGKPMVMGRR